MRLGVFFSFALAACGADMPTPDYPFPSPRPLEETDLWQYLGEEDALLEEDVDEEWDDGLDDADLSLDGDHESPPESAASDGAESETGTVPPSDEAESEAAAGE